MTERASTPPTRLVLLGHPVAHSLSPVFQNAALEAAALPQRYSALDVAPARLAATIEALRAERAGGNVTIPHKEAVAALADRRTSVAERAGAVNTFWFEGDTLVGHNTDVEGVTATLHALPLPALDVERCAVLGAGGSAGAVLVALDALGVRRPRLWGRTPERAAALSARVRVPVDLCGSAEEAVRDATLVVHCTPIGLHDRALPVPIETLAPGCAVFDLVYGRGETPFVRAARARGHAALDGTTMLIEQGAAAFRCWFGIEPARTVMWDAVRSA